MFTKLSEDQRGLTQTDAFSWQWPAERTAFEELLSESLSNQAAEQSAYKNLPKGQWI